MTENKLYPVVSDLLPLEKIPSELESIKEAIEKLLGKIYFKDLIVGKSYHGEAGYYTLTLLSLKPLGLDIPFVNDLKLVVNPSDEGTVTEIPITLDYSWEVLKYFSAFNFSSFDNSVRSIFNVLFELAGISKEELFSELLNTFFNDYEALLLFVTQFNTDHNTTLAVNNSDTDASQLRSVLSQIEESDVDFVQYILTKYIEQADFNQSFENLQSLLGRWYGDITSTDISEILKIKFRFSIPNVSLGLLFPRKWLKPLGTDFAPLPEPAQSVLEFNAGALEYFTQSGFQFIKENSFSLTRSEIANTGIIIEFDQLKVDLSNDTNIPEAIADGRPENFKGVYAQLAAITLPPRWFDETDSHPGTTARIAGYDMLIGTGGISGTVALEAITIPQTTVTDYYGDCFTFQYPISITADSNTIEVEDSSDLLRQLNTLGNTPYSFNFPLSLTTVEGKIETFENQTAYADFLKDCKTAGAPPRIIKKIGKNGFEVWFTSFDITFKQNKIVASSILGGLKIPRLKDANGDTAEIEIFGHFDESGDFLVSASEKDGFEPIGIPNVVQFYIKTVELGRENGKFFIGCSCDIYFPSVLMQSLIGNQPIQIQSLRIYSDGSFEILGGTIPVPANFTINLGPVEVAITNINLGSYQQEYKGKKRKYMVFGFDGAINLGNLGFEARGKGMQFYFTVDKGEFHSEFRIQTIEADLIIPGNASAASATAIIKGFLSIPQPGESKEYSGGVSLQIPKAKISGSVAIRLQPRYPAFLLDATVNLPTPIPIVPPLSISGFRGLLGFRYIAEKEAIGLKSGPNGDTWYDYYTYPKRGIDINKFSGPDKSQRAKSGFSVGAGATLVSSDGVLVSARVMFILSIPSLFVFDGRASILSEALGLDDSGDPPFFAFVAIGDNSLEIGAGIDFQLPKKSGVLMSVRAGMEARFPFRNSSAWYLNIGTREKPNEARVFTLITMQSYLELSGRGIALGARAEFNFDKSFGPARVRAWLYAEVGGEISFERPQIGGYVAAGGGADVKFWIIRIGISLDVLFGAEVPKPFRIYAEARVCGRIKIGFIKISKCISVKIKWEKNKSVDTTPIEVLPLRVADQNVKGISMLTGEAFDLYRISGNNVTPNSPVFKNNAPVLPLDTYVDIKFLKPVIPNAIKNSIGGVNHRAEGAFEYIPPKASSRGKHFRQVKHEFRIKSFTIEIWNENAWVHYNPYKAIINETQNNTIRNLDRFKAGQWQKTERKYNAIRVLGNNPFSFTQRGERGWFIPEQVGISASSLFCEDTFDYKKRANWRNKRIGSRYKFSEFDLLADIEGTRATDIDKFYAHQGISFSLVGNTLAYGVSSSNGTYARVAKARGTNFNFGRGLEFDSRNILVLRYNDACKEVSYKLNTGASEVTFVFYRATFSDADAQVVLVEFDRQSVKASELQEEYTYIPQGDNVINQVSIIPKLSNQEEIAQIRQQIDDLLDFNVDRLVDEDDASLEVDTSTELEELLERLEVLEEQGCRRVPIPSTGIGSMILTDDFIVGKETSFVDLIEERICETTLFETAWLTEQDFLMSTSIAPQEAISEDFKANIEAISKVAAPIWRPDSQYRISFSLTDTVNGKEARPFNYKYGFATAGPVGHYPVGDQHQVINYGTYSNSNFKLDLSQEAKDRYAHTNLREYIDYKRSYPNANGDLLRSKPLFYGTRGGSNKISIYYLKAYTFHMFRDWHAYKGPEINTSLEVLIKDPIEDITLSNPPASTTETTEIPTTTIEWTSDTKALFPTEYQMLNNLATAEEGCLQLDEPILTIPKRYITEATIKDMKPQKMYTAIINAKYKNRDKEVHNFVFQTSRYKSFDEQINSYLLKNDVDGVEAVESVNQAKFLLKMAISEKSLKAAYNIVAGDGLTDKTSKFLEGAKIDFFDRVIEGLFEMSPLDPATTTEFNFIKNTITGDIVALLIRNPEPFNDPKIPLEIINGEETKLKQAFSIRSNNKIDENYKVLYAKDYSQLLVMYKQENKIALTAEELTMQFKYLLWDGFSYDVQSTVLINGLTINFNKA